MSNTNKYESIIRKLHEEWAVKNGYRLGAASKVDTDRLHAINSERFVESAKPQATSVKRQASS